ncbi:MAG: hypothetical protein ACLFSQ_08980 [Candidatus Zixiibacteriota bacterium]
MKKLIILAALIILTGFAIGQELVGARALGMGGAYTSVVDDATALRWNPGAIGRLDQRTISGGFSRLYLGVDNDNLGQGFMGYAQRVGKLGNIGLGWTNLFSNVYSENTFHFGYGYDLGKNMPAVHTLGIGVTGNMLMTGYNKSEFVPNPDEAVDIRNSSVFANAISSTGIAVDFGILFKPNPNASAALVVNNINQPNTSLEGAEVGAVPLSGAFGFSYRFRDYLIPSVDLRFINWDINDKNKFEYNVGIESWFSEQTIGIRGGINPNDLSLGATYNILSKPSFQINYAFLYPLSKMGKVSTTHRVSLTARMPYKPPKPKFLNFHAISVDLPEDVRAEGLYIEDKTLVTGKFIKTGKLAAKDVNVLMLVKDPEGEYEILGKKQFSSVRSDDTVSVSYSFSQSEEGNYDIFLHVDDDGSAIPEINGMIEETDEGDNTAKATIKVKKASEIDIDLEAKSLKITKASIRRTEEPQVPAVFFDENSIAADARYDYMLQKVSERLADNPDAVLVLRGYHSSITEEGREDLAKSRALVVFRKLLMMDVDPKQLRVDSTGYNKGKMRAREQYALERDKRMVAEENRRVELTVEIPHHDSDLFEEFTFAKGSDKFTGSIENAALFRQLLSKNEHFVVLAKGIIGSDESGDPTLGLRRASSIKEALAAEMPEYEDHIYIFDRISDSPGGGGSVKMLAEGILYKPYETETMPTSVKLSERENRVTVDYSANANIQSHHIYIQRDDGEIVKTIAEGDGSPKREYMWDWTDESGEILAPGSQYRAVGQIVDERGAEANAKSDQIHVEVKEIVDIVENILIVNFNFDTPTPVSEFFETRLDMTARKFIEDAKRDDFKLRATVEGHTDVVGNKSRNLELSKERSLREYNNIKRYMKYLLDIKTDSELQAWMREHEARLDYLGVGFSKPYQIKKQVAGSEVEVLVGDNKLPEGRNVNRRVIIEYKLIPKGE